jgi:hypothetical protein
VRPQLGRTFTAEEDREGGPLVMMISHELWQRRFSGDRNIVGRAVRFGTAGKTRTVVGVLPPGFRFPADEIHRDYYTPFHEDLGPVKTQRDAIWINVAAKMRPGVTIDQANAELKAISARLEKQYPTENAGVEFTSSSMHEGVVSDVRPALLMLFGAVAVVLLIGCANVANLLLARATARHKEISIRAAIGASPGRITVQLLVESVVLSLIAGAAGLLLASWGIDALLAFAVDRGQTQPPAQRARRLGGRDVAHAARGRGPAAAQLHPRHRDRSRLRLSQHGRDEHLAAHAPLSG